MTSSRFARHIVAAVLAGVFLAGCASTAEPPLPPPAPAGPDYEGYLKAVEGTPAVGGPYGSREAACWLKEQPDMTRDEAIDFVTRGLSNVVSREEAEMWAHRHLDAIDRYNMCPGSDWERDG